MHFSLVLFTGDRGISPAKAAELAHWAELDVTEILFGLPDRSDDEIAAYVDRLASTLAVLQPA